MTSSKNQSFSFTSINRLSDGGNDDGGSDDDDDNGYCYARRAEMKPRVFSKTAQKVFDAGRELWRYYHEQPKSNPNASLYDIREHFQGRNDNGKMNATSSDAVYTHLIGKLRSALKTLAAKIEPKVYEYGFLKE